MVFDDDDGMSFVDKAMKNVGESGDILLVESDCWFFDEVEVGVLRTELGDRFASFGELSDEFESLSFTSADSG